MKNLNKIFFLLSLSAALLTSCGEEVCIPGEGLNELTIKKEAVNPTEITHKFLKATGEYVVSNGPTIISADEVYENLSDYLVIDLRSKDLYEEGHVNGALNVKLDSLVDYMKNNVSANAYKKIVFTCKTGQTAAFAAGALRTIGYNNVYSMKYGMNAWSNENTNYWSDAVSNKFANKLESKNNTKAKAGKFPEIKSERQLASSILEERAQTIFNQGFKVAKISADEVFANPSKFYIINYWPKDRYDAGHIEGAVQYTPKKDLKLDGALNTLPTDKTIVVYCYTGQNAASTVAYLRMLGYDAKTIAYGANSFMNSTLVDKGWAGFTSSAVANAYPMIEGKNPTNAKASNIATKAQPTKKKKAVKRKKKAVSGGCG
ncbi:MAG: rhodanese-like domain-containing protein [Bacteroidota bacterium]